MDSITNWLMVGITAVYVIATIFICVANLRAAEATRDQVDESKRQFLESQRLQIIPYLQISFTESYASDPTPCAFIEMRKNKDECITTQILFSIKNIGLGIAHHTRITVTTRYKKDDGYPAYDIVMPPNCEKKTHVRFFVEKYDGKLGRKEDLTVNVKYDDILGNSYTQTAQLIMVVQPDRASLLPAINMSSPQLESKSEDNANA